MKERKHIDRLYQEKFRDFEPKPREEVWKAISADLQGQESKKPLIGPLWSRLAGVAALLSLIFLIGDWFSVSEPVRITNQEREIQDRPSRENPIPEQISIATAVQENETSLTGAAASSAVPRPKRPPMEVVQNTSSLSALGLKKDQLDTYLPETSSKEPESKTSGSDEKPEPGTSIFEAIAAAKKNEELEKIGQGKLVISTQAAPIFYGNLGKGNFLDPQFNDNPSEGEVTFSYGISLAYAISDKIKIRSGINKVSMSYNTGEIAYHTAVDPRAISSINYSGDLNLHITDLPVKGGSSVNGPQSMTKSRVGNFSPALLNQKLGYIEVPVELQYNLLDKRIEINIIGGGSTMFLDQNTISLNSSHLNTELGEANNLNKVSFSTNVGIGVDYRLTDQFKLNFEPMFKYQLNTFSTNSGLYRPYFLGIYSGFSFEF